MGCAGSKRRDSGGRSLRPPGFCSPSPRVSEADQKLASALKELKVQMDEEQSLGEAFSFTKIILKLGTIERMLRRVKAVFRSVDHGNKGHVTKNELKEGLHRAKVDLGEAWHDTDINECLEHLGGAVRGQDGTDKIGLREFVVMLAVGRVCRTQRPRSTVFAPLPPDSAAAAAAEPSRSLAMKTIVEVKDENRRPSLESVPSGNQAGGEDIAAAIAAARIAAAEDEREAEKSAATTGKTPTGAPTVIGSEGATMLPADSGQAAPPPVDGCVSATPEAKTKPHTASAGPGGVPREGSWRDLRWPRIPSLQNLEASGRSTRTSSNVSKKRPVGEGGGGSYRASVGGKRVAQKEANVAESVKYVLDLFIAAYFQFDPTGQGYITKQMVEKKLRQSLREPGTSHFMDERKWEEVAWNGDRLSFQEFIYGFAQWLGLLEEDDDSASVVSQSQHAPPVLQQQPATRTASHEPPSHIPGAPVGGGNLSRASTATVNESDFGESCVSFGATSTSSADIFQESGAYSEYFNSDIDASGSNDHFAAQIKAPMPPACNATGRDSGSDEIRKPQHPQDLLNPPANRRISQDLELLQQGPNPRTGVVENSPLAF